MSATPSGLRAEPSPRATSVAVAPRPARALPGAALLRSPPLRVGMTFWLLFVVILVLTGTLFDRSLRESLLGDIDDSLAARSATIATVQGRLGTDATLELMESVDATNERTRFHFAGSDGERVRGDLPRAPTSPGRRTLSGETLGLDDGDRYRVLTRPFGDGMLTIAAELRSLDELRVVAFECLLRALAVATLLGILASLSLAWRMHRRMAGWSAALGRVTKGDLGARLPLGRSGDDVDAMAERINEMLERLRRTVESMRQVSTDIAHDLKTPLNRLTIDLEEAVELNRANRCVSAPLERALGEASEINGTFEALLSIARIEAGARKARFRTFGLTPMIDDLVEIYAPVVEEAGLALRTDVAAGDPLRLHGDRALITQLIVNLVENALRHGAPSATTITLSADRRNGRIRLGVADDGPGVPAAEREKVFRRLYRLERSRTTRGTGLGLSLVKAIAELHCGSIDVADNGPGLRVTITFDDRCPLEP